MRLNLKIKTKKIKKKRLLINKKIELNLTQAIRDLLIFYNGMALILNPTLY